MKKCRYISTGDYRFETEVEPRSVCVGATLKPGKRNGVVDRFVLTHVLLSFCNFDFIFPAAQQAYLGSAYGFSYKSEILFRFFVRAALENKCR